MWGAERRFRDGANLRILHTMIRVGDLRRSIDFYTQVLGMRLLRKTDYPGGRFTNAFVGYDDESRAAVLELTHNWDTKSYDNGSGFGPPAPASMPSCASCPAVTIPFSVLRSVLRRWPKARATTPANTVSSRAGCGSGANGVSRTTADATFGAGSKASAGPAINFSMAERDCRLT